VRIVVNHLTRMSDGHVCVAGVDVATQKHVRPVLSFGRLSSALLRREGGIFDVGVEVDLGKVTARPTNPEREDHVFDPENVSAIGTMAGSKYWKLLNEVAETRLQTIFGAAMHPQGRGCAVDENDGTVSLGCLVPRSLRVELNPWGKLRAHMSDGKRNVELSVADIRLYKGDGTPKKNAVLRLQQRLAAREAVVVSVGLARAFMAQNDTKRRHWLQLNNIHIGSDPVWQCD
jgi:hypothetical protein